MLGSVLSVLKDNRVVFPDALPLKAKEYDSKSRVQIIDIPKSGGGILGDFMVYDNVTISPGGILTQNEGTQYFVSIIDGRFLVGAKRDIDIQENLIFGSIKLYLSDYYITNREFVGKLEATMQ